MRYLVVPLPKWKVKMSSQPYSGEPSSSSTSCHTKLLDLPDELISRILDFLIPKPAVCPPAATGHESNIGFTCTRLFTLVESRLHTLDFCYPRSCVRYGNYRKLYRNIETFTRLASPYLAVLRLPEDFWPKDPRLTTLGACPHLKELSFPVKDDLDQKGAENFFANHQKLEVLKITDPSGDVLTALQNVALNLRKLDLIQLKATNHMLSLLEAFLPRLPTLESLTVCFRCGQWSSVDMFEGERQHVLKPQEVLESFGSLLRRRRKRLSELRELSINVMSGYSYGDIHQQDPDGVQKMARQISRFGTCVKDARGQAGALSLFHNLTTLRLGIHSEGEQHLAQFMKGLVSHSTNVIADFQHITISYQGIVDGIWPKPMVKRLDCNYEDYGALFQSADMNLRSIKICKKEFSEQLRKKSSRVLLSNLFREGNLESINIDYELRTDEDVRSTMDFLHFVTSFAPTLRSMTIPIAIVLRPDMTSSAELKKMKCSQSLSVLRLQFMRRFYQTTGSPHDGNVRSFTAKLPQFLDSIRQAFPNLTHLDVDRTSVRQDFPILAFLNRHRVSIRQAIDEETFRKVETMIRAYESESGVDASSLLA